MSPVERLEAAAEWIERRDKMRVYRAPETLSDSEKWSIGLWAAIYNQIQTCLTAANIERNWDTLVYTEATLALADAILAGEK